MGRCRCGGEVVLGREPVDVADLTEERGGQHRPHPEQLQQAVLDWGTWGLDPRLHGGDPLLQLANVGGEISGQLPAGDRRRFGLGAVAGVAGQSGEEPVDGQEVGQAAAVG